MQILFYVPSDVIRRCFAAADIRRLSQAHTLYVPDSVGNLLDLSALWQRHAASCQALVTGWQTPSLTDAMLDAAPNLQVLVHAAGSVKHILPDSFWSRQIVLASCRDALAVGVAETTLGLIIAGLKRFFPADQLTRQGDWKADDFATALKVRELFDLRIGIVGASRVGRHLIRLLRCFEVSVVVYDPYLSEQDAKDLGVERSDLNDLVATCDVVSLHAPKLPQTHHMIGAAQLQQLQNDALLVNTARGALIDEDALVREVKTGRITAMLDVTDPEPPACDHPLRDLPNCVILPHIAGAVANGCGRLGRSVVDQLLTYSETGILAGGVTQSQMNILG